MFSFLFSQNVLLKKVFESENIRLIIFHIYYKKAYFVNIILWILNNSKKTDPEQVLKKFVEKIIALTILMRRTCQKNVTPTALTLLSKVLPCTNILVQPFFFIFHLNVDVPSISEHLNF